MWTAENVQANNALFVPRFQQHLLHESSTYAQTAAIREQDQVYDTEFAGKPIEHEPADSAAFPFDNCELRVRKRIGITPAHRIKLVAHKIGPSGRIPSGQIEFIFARAGVKRKQQNFVFPPLRPQAQGRTQAVAGCIVIHGCRCAGIRNSGREEKPGNTLTRSYVYTIHKSFTNGTKGGFALVFCSAETSRMEFKINLKVTGQRQSMDRRHYRKSRLGLLFHS